MTSHLFEDHSDALLIWQRLGCRELTCVHVDAHLDLMEECFEPAALAALAEAENLHEFREEAGPFGPLLHCANYLYPALAIGVVSELIWVVPEKMWDPERPLRQGQALLDHWLDIPLPDMPSWRIEGGALCGTLLGTPFTLCDSSTLPSLTNASIALDIDLDYFIDVHTDDVWQTPHQPNEKLNLASPSVLTVATSVDGGYTPVQELYLGEVCLEVFSGGNGWRQETEELLEADRLPEDRRRDRWEQLLAHAPEPMRPALLSRLGRMEEAQSCDERYQIKLENRIARCIEKKDWSRGLALIDGDEKHPELALYCHYGEQDWERVVKSFELLKDVPRRGPTTLKIRQLVGEALHRLGRLEESEHIFKRAIELDPSLPGAYFQLGRVQMARDRLKPAARSFQKALRLSRGRLSSLTLLGEAARYFQQMGESALASTARKELGQARRQLVF